MKKVFLVFVIISLVCGMAFATGAAEQTQKAAVKGCVMGSSGMTGSWYPVAAAVSTQVKKYSDYVLTVQASGGSGENIRLMKQGEYQLGMINSAIIDAAWNGNKNFEGEAPWRDVRFVCNLFPTGMQPVVWKSSDINSFADIKGHSIAPGSAGSGDAVQYEEVLGFYGITTKDVDWRPLTQTERVTSMKDKQLEVAGFCTSWPAGSIIELAASRPIKIVSFEKSEDKNKFLEQYPYYGIGVIKAGTYHGMDEDVEVITTGSLFASIPEVPDDYIYNLLECMYKGIEEVQAVHGMSKYITEATGADMRGVIPFHPGAEKYFKDRGIIK